MHLSRWKTYQTHSFNSVLQLCQVKFTYFVPWTVLYFVLSNCVLCLVDFSFIKHYYRGILPLLCRCIAFKVKLNVAYSYSARCHRNKRLLTWTQNIVDTKQRVYSNVNLLNLQHLFWYDLNTVSLGTIITRFAILTIVTCWWTCTQNAPDLNVLKAFYLMVQYIVHALEKSCRKELFLWYCLNRLTYI